MVIYKQDKEYAIFNKHDLARQIDKDVDTCEEFQSMLDDFGVLWSYHNFDKLNTVIEFDDPIKIDEVPFAFNKAILFHGERTITFTREFDSRHDFELVALSMPYVLGIIILPNILTMMYTPHE